MTRPLAVSLLALALYLGIWDCLLTLGLSTLHGWLRDLLGQTGLWIAIVATTLGAGWVVCDEREE